jgi:CubicO group peptidase (beta-lactamase class C family)
MSFPDFGPAFAALDAFVAARMEAGSTPGLAPALTDRERTLRVATYGARDLAAGLPVGPETLFEVG